MAAPTTRIVAMRPVAEDLQRYQAAFERNEDEKDLAALQWLYQKNPARDVYVDFAVPEDGDELAAIYAVAAVRADVNGRTTLGVQSLDTLTDRDFRGRGLFTKLAADVYRRCAEGGVSFVYGFPNASSAHGFFNRLGWVNLDPVPFLIRPLRTGYALRRLKLGPLARLDLPLPIPTVRLGPEHELRVVLDFDDDFDELWADFASQVRVAVRRDAAYLKWRLSKPRERYKTVAHYEGGRLQGFVTFATKEKHGGKVGYVVELLHRPGAEHSGRALVAAALREMRDQGAEVVLGWCLEHSPNRAAYRAGGFRYLPERLRPIELHFGVRALASGPEDALGNRRNWYLSYCDSDTV